MRKARTDNNHKPIRDALRAIGCVCADCHRHGDGFPDLFVFDPVSGAAFLAEIKTGNGKLTEREQAFFDTFAGCKILVIWHSVDEALHAVEEARYQHDARND
jgi:hypothetical protein